MRPKCVLTAGILSAAGWCAWAQMPEPAAVPASQPTVAEETVPAVAAPGVRPKSILDLHELTFDLGFEGQLDRRSVTDYATERLRRDYRQTNRSRAFEETIGVRTSGNIWDEKVAQFDVMARYGLAQHGYSEARPGHDLSEYPSGDLFEYDLNLRLLPRGKISADAYAQRLDSRLPRTFLPSLDRTLERYGGGVYVNDPTFPMRFTFEHTWDELTSRTRNLDDEEQRGGDTFRYEGTWQISPQQSLRLEYEYNDRHERYSGTKTRFDTTRNYVTLNHTLRFGADNKSSLETLLRYQDESGDLARDESEASTRLRLQLTDSLAANIAAQYLRDSFQELSTTTTRGEGGLTHQLGETLTSTFQMYGLTQQANDNADFHEWGGLANVAFNKPNALGRFSANLSYNHATTDSSDGTQRGIVIGESVTFRDPLPSYLVHDGVDRVSIIVTDGNRTRTYLPGRDYRVLQIGRYTALTRVPTGAITDRQTVLVSYTYKVSNDYHVSRDRLDVRVQQDFKIGLTPYYAGSFQQEDAAYSRRLGYRDRDVNRQRLGATFRQKRWSLGMEYEYNDDSIDPYQAIHTNGDVIILKKANHQLDAKTAMSWFWFDGTSDWQARDTLLLDLGTNYRCLLMRDLEANFTALYRYEHDSLAGTTNGVDLTASVDWKLGLFSLRVEAEYDLLNLPGSRDDSVTFWIKLRRDIPVIARDAR